MTEDSEKEFLDRLSACIEEIDLDACVSKAADLAKERGISPEKLLELSDGKYKAGQFKLEYVLALAAAQNLDEKATAYFYVGQASHELLFFEKVEELYRKAIDSDQNFAPAHYNLGYLLNELGRKTAAEEQYRRAIKADYNHAPARTNLGNLLNELDRKTEAEEQYRLAIKADPNLAPAHNNYAYILREKERFSEAEKEVRIALDIDQLNPYYLGTLGDILAYEGWLDEAEKEYKSALERLEEMDDAAKSEIYNNLGWVYTQKGILRRPRMSFLSLTNLIQEM